MSKSFGYGGEDAYFVETKSNSKSNNNNNNNNNNDDDDKSARSTELSLGVADGVYMWRWKGVDAGLYSRALLREAAEDVFEQFKNRWIKVRHVGGVIVR